MAADVLPGYRVDTRTHRYHSNATGKFVAHRTITNLMETHVNDASARVGELTTAFHEGRLSPVVWADQMRTELRRLTLQNEALGAGGWDRLGPVQWGRAGRDLRDLYAEVAGTAQDVTEGKITLVQALSRANEYAGSARSHFFAAERETAQPSATNMMVIERRMLGTGGKTRKDCVEYYEMGWQPLGVLPSPCTDSVCGGNCKCRMERKEVPISEAGEWIGTYR